MLRARLARFYGWTDREIGRMSYARCRQYLMSIESLRAEEKLHMLGVSSFPHMKREQARQFEKKLKDEAKRYVNRGKAPQSTEELYHHLIRTLGNG